MSVIFEEENTFKENTESLNRSKAEDDIFNINSKLNFNELIKVYYYKLNLLKNNQKFKDQVNRLWEILDKTEAMKIKKETYFSLLRKIYLFILPIYNRKEIDTFVSNEYSYISYDKPDINYEQFVESIFKLIHTWSTHINKFEYASLLELVINRISKRIYICLDGSIIEPKYYIVSKIIKKIDKSEFDRETFEPAYPDTPNIYDYYEENDNEAKNLQRLNVIHYLDLDSKDDDFFIYDEDVVYQQEILRDSKYYYIFY